MPLVSLKYVIINTLHIIVFYLGFFLLINILNKITTLFILAFSVSLMVVMTYFWFNFYQVEFNSSSLVVLAKPFYKDNTIFSASLSMVLPWTLAIKPDKSYQRFLMLSFGLYIMVTIVSLNCRAAWLGLLAASVLTLLIKFTFLNFKNFIWLCIATIVVSAVMIGSIKLKKTSFENEKEKTGNKLETIISIAQPNTDVSNLERINRYKCALRMFAQRPLFGYGPGTFQFAYLPFQVSEEMTRLSIVPGQTSDAKDPPNGRGGGAHSEYLQALSENGLPGFIIWLSLILTTYLSAFRCYSNAPIVSKKYILASVFGLTTFFIHGLFNNFLHSEEIASLFWLMIAGIVWMDAEFMRTSATKNE